MGISERKEREKQEMRNNIIAAAITMFTEEGYEKTSIRKIADKIEYSPATIYLYYKDKDELLYDVQHEAFDRMAEEFRKQPASTDPIKRLRHIMENYIEFGIKEPALYDLMFIIRSPMNVVEEKHTWTNGDDAFGVLFQCVSECIEQGLIRYKDPMQASLSIWAMGHGLISLDIRCRYKIFELTEAQKAEMIRSATHEFLELIKN